MIYQKTITVTKNTTKDNMMMTKLQLCKGLLYKINLYFPPGSCGLLGLAVYESGSRIYPIDDNEFFIGDNINYSFDDTRDISDQPYIYDIYTYNIDTIYDHTCIIQIGLSTEEDLQSRYNGSSIITLLDKYINNKTADYKATLLDKLKSLRKR